MKQVGLPCLRVAKFLFWKSSRKRCFTIQPQWHCKGLACLLFSSGRIKPWGALCSVICIHCLDSRGSRLSTSYLGHTHNAGYGCRDRGRHGELNKSHRLYSMLGNRKKAIPQVKNGAGTSELKAIDPLRNLGECFCYSSLCVYYALYFYRKSTGISPTPSDWENGFARR